MAVFLPKVFGNLVRGKAGHLWKCLLSLAILLFNLATAGNVYALASNNIPLDSPVYGYLDKLVGFGLLDTELRGQRPYARAEVARLVAEAEANLERVDSEARPFAEEFIGRIREYVPREYSLRNGEKPQLFDLNPVSYSRVRYVYLDGIPRSYDRWVWDPGNQSAFGFIGGNLRPGDQMALHESGSEGTPLLENNEGVRYGKGNSAEFMWATEGYLGDLVSFLFEPLALTTPDGEDRNNEVILHKGYAKLGSGGLELEVGRDANWFGPGYRGSTTLTSNAKNLDAVKLSSPEPVDIAWVKRNLGQFKYKLIFSRLDETGVGAERRRPYFIGIDLSLKPRPWYEAGIHFVRMEGGPGFSGPTSLKDEIFGGGFTNKNATTAGIDLRFRIPWLRNTEIYGDYSGSDSAMFWPIVESYVAGLYIPRLTPSGKDDLRFEFFYGSPKLYTDWKFPAGYVYDGMPFGHSQGGATIEFFLRYSHWFTPRNNAALEYIRTDRGDEWRVPLNAGGNYDPNGVMQTPEHKHAVRLFWNLPVYGDWDTSLMYGWEHIDNFNLVAGDTQINQIFKLDLKYRY